MADRSGFTLGFCIWALRIPLLILTRRDWHGAENVPRQGGCVLAPNHISEIDPLAVGHFVAAAGRPPRYLAKASLFSVPVMGPILRRAGQIPVERQSADAAGAFGAAVAEVRAGRAVIVYPEGTITRDPEAWPMVGKTGAARIALATGCPVIPIGQWGAQELLAAYAARPHVLPPKRMHVTAGPPVDLSDLYGEAPTAAVLTEATERIMRDITVLVADLRGEPAPAERFDPRAAGVPLTGRPDREKGRRGRRGKASSQ